MLAVVEVDQLYQQVERVAWRNLSAGMPVLEMPLVAVVVDRLTVRAVLVEPLALLAQLLSSLLLITVEVVVAAVRMLRAALEAMGWQC